MKEIYQCAYTIQEERKINLIKKNVRLISEELKRFHKEISLKYNGKIKKYKLFIYMDTIET